MGFEGDYWETPTARTMEWYVGVVRADNSGPTFRPFKVTAAPDTNTDLSASITLDMGDNSNGSTRSALYVQAGATQVVKFVPTKTQFFQPVIISGTGSFTVGDATAATDSTVTINTQAGNINTLQFSKSGVAKWILYDAGSAQLFLRDTVNGQMAMEFRPASGTNAEVVFIGGIRAGTFIQCGSGATGARKVASEVGAGAMWFDTTLGKPIWSNGIVWKDATGATV